MSKKQQYTTKFYEVGNGKIFAVVLEDGKPVNVTCNLADGQSTGTEVLEAAREGWPYADQFDSSEWSGLSMEQAAEELEKGTHTPVGEERPVDLIAETRPTPAHVSGLPFVTLYWRHMGAAGFDLFKDLDMPEAVAYRIKSSREWNPDDCRKLCELADMADEYDNADSDTVEDVVSAAADKLDVEIW